MRNGVASPNAQQADALPPGGDRTPVLEITGLSKNFGSRMGVESISFALDQHEFVAVLGPSGAGKTTLFRCMTGMTGINAGRILFGGTEIQSLAPARRRQIALVFQQFNLVSRLSALQNVLAGRLPHTAMWRGVFRCFERADILKAFESLERVGLLDEAHQRADTLSGGQQQRVAIARALAQEPRLIVADEPVASLDPMAAAGVLELLKEIARYDGVAVICSLHQVNYARVYADRIIGLSRGRTVIDAQTQILQDSDFAALYANSHQTGGLSAGGC